MNQLELIHLSPFSSFEHLMSGLELIKIGTNHSANMAYLLAVTAPADYREYQPHASFAKIKIDRTQTVVVYVIDEFGHECFKIPEQSWNYHFVQPLPDDEILLVCGRSAYRGHDDFDLNGHVFNYEGKLKRSFLLGDGIQDVQTTADGRIWTSYFDEGIFGNYGWKHPIGSPGLILWDKTGSKLYEYSPVYPLDFMADCYALNVVSNQETWCYYYTDFPLVQIRNGEVVRSWNSAVSGSHGFAVCQNYILFQGGYRNHDQHLLYQLGTKGEMDLQAVYELRDENGQKITAEMHTTRGHIFYFIQNNKLYKLDLRDVI